MLSLWRRKARVVSKLFWFGVAAPGAVQVAQGNATALPLPDASVDYCFTGPPFGSNIFYGDCATVWESWLGEVTPVRCEAVVNRSLRPPPAARRSRTTPR